MASSMGAGSDFCLEAAASDSKVDSSGPFTASRMRSNSCRTRWSEPHLDRLCSRSTARSKFLLASSAFPSCNCPPRPGTPFPPGDQIFDRIRLGLGGRPAPLGGPGGRRVQQFCLGSWRRLDLGQGRRVRLGRRMFPWGRDSLASRSRPDHGQEPYTRQMKLLDPHFYL